MLKNIISKSLRVVKAIIFPALIFGIIAYYIFRDKHHSLLCHILSIFGVIVMIFVFSGAFLVIPYSDIWNRMVSFITGKKKTDKDKLYRAIYEALDEIFEYWKEFKQKYPEEGRNGKKERRIKNKMKILLPPSS